MSDLKCSNDSAEDLTILIKFLQHKGYDVKIKTNKEKIEIYALKELKKSLIN